MNSPHIPVPNGPTQRPVLKTGFTRSMVPWLWAKCLFKHFFNQFHGLMGIVEAKAVYTGLQKQRDILSWDANPGPLLPALSTRKLLLNHQQAHLGQSLKSIL